MPISHASGGGAAKPPARTPAKTPPENPFFKAVAGKRSPLNRQSSRIANPFATSRYLGGGDKPTVSTPDEQAFLFAPAAKKGDPKAIAAEANYIAAHDTQHTVAPQKPIGGTRASGAELPGAALTAPDIGVQAQRALGLVTAHVPLGSVGTKTALDALSKIDLPTNIRQQVIGGFAADKSLDTPYTKEMLVAQALSKNASIPAHATTKQLLDAALGQKPHHSIGDLLSPMNWIKDAIETPVYTFEGGYALGHASRQALPNAIGGKGQIRGLEAIGKGELAQAEHPLLTAEKNPFQTALAAATVFKGLGKFAGAASGAEATAREVPIDTSFGPHTLDMGDYSKNLYDRAGQKLMDAHLSRSPRRQATALATETRRTASLETERSARELKNGPAGEAFKKSRANISAARQDSLLANEGQGFTAEEAAAHYTRAADQTRAAADEPGLANSTRRRLLNIEKKQRAQAGLRAKQAEKWGTTLEPHEQDFVNAARAAADERTRLASTTTTASGTPALDATSALWRDYQHNIEIRAGQGNARALAVQKARAQLDAQDFANGRPTDPDAYRVASDHLASTLDHYIMNEKGIHPEGQTPFRVPTRTIRGAAPFRPMGAQARIAARNDPRTIVSGLQHSSGAALASGNYLTRSEDFARQLIEPHKAIAAIRYTNRLKERFGRPLVAGETVQPNEVIVQAKNLRAGLRGTLSATHALDEHAAALDNLRDEFKVNTDGTASQRTVPDGARKGTYIAMPEPVVAEIVKSVQRVAPTWLHGVTRAYKNSVLFTRLAYPASNFVNSATQAALGGVTPGAILHRNDVETPVGVADHGLMASYTDDPGRTGLRTSLAEAKFATGVGGKSVAAVRGLGNAAADVPRAIKFMSIEADNVWRKALYVAKAKKAARAIAYPDEGAVSRLLRHRSIADEKIVAAYKQMADGATPAAKRAADAAIKATNDFLGDFKNMKRYDALDLAMPFNSWTRFSAGLLFKTLPLKYPGRTALLYKISQLGQQGTSQQGLLPQYLQEQVPLGGSPTREWAGYFQRADPFATIGTTFAPLTPGADPYLGGIVGSLNPAGILPLDAALGTDIEQNRTLRDAQGNPIAGNAMEQGEYALGQLAGLVPPLVAASGGTRGKADTSIPFLNEQNRSATKDPLGGPQPSQPGWLPWLNQALFFRLDVRNMTADQIKGEKAYRAQLVAAANKNPQMAMALKHQGTPAYNAAIAKITATAGKLGASIDRFINDPAAAQKIIDEGTK